MLDGVWNYVTAKGNPYTYYFIMVKNATHLNTRTNVIETLCGIGFGLNQNSKIDKYNRVILVALSTNSNIRTFTNTCGHELGHSAFKLQHPFQSPSTPGVNSGYNKFDDPDNFMDYLDGHKAREYQWKFIRDQDLYPNPPSTP
jgi:hypothetical protein